MARFVRLESHEDNAPPVWVNPEHVVSITAPGVPDSGTFVSTTRDCYRVLPDAEDVADMLHLVYRIDPWEPDKAAVKENLNR